MDCASASQIARNSRIRTTSPNVTRLAVSWCIACLSAPDGQTITRRKQQGVRARERRVAAPRQRHAERRYEAARERRPTRGQCAKTGVIWALASVWNTRLNDTAAALASESTPSVSTSTACTTKKYRCGRSPGGG